MVQQRQSTQQRSCVRKPVTTMSDPEFVIVNLIFFRVRA
jgi:hypothetical protein